MAATMHGGMAAVGTACIQPPQTSSSAAGCRKSQTANGRHHRRWHQPQPGSIQRCRGSLLRRQGDLRTPAAVGLQADSGAQPAALQEARPAWQSVSAICAAAMLLCSLHRSAFTMLVPAIAADLGLGLPQIGVLQSAMLGGYLVGQIPAGRLADRLGGERVLLAGLFFGSLAVAATGLAAAVGAGGTAVPALLAAGAASGTAAAAAGVSGTVAAAGGGAAAVGGAVAAVGGTVTAAGGTAMMLLIAARAATGLFQAAAMPAVTAMAARWVPPAVKASTLALIYAAFNIGGVLGLLLTPALAVRCHWPWPASLLALGAAGALWAVVGATLLPKVSSQATAHPGHSRASGSPPPPPAGGGGGGGAAEPLLQQQQQLHERQQQEVQQQLLEQVHEVQRRQQQQGLHGEARETRVILAALDGSLMDYSAGSSSAASSSKRMAAASSSMRTGISIDIALQAVGGGGVGSSRGRSGSVGDSAVISRTSSPQRQQSGGGGVGLLERPVAADVLAAAAAPASAVTSRSVDDSVSAGSITPAEISAAVLHAGDARQKTSPLPAASDPPLPAPLGRGATMVQLGVLCWAHAVIGVTFILQSWVPLYLKSAGVTTTWGAGALSSLTVLAAVFVGVGSGQAGDRLIKHGVPRLTVRHGAHALSTLGCALAVLPLVASASVTPLTATLCLIANNALYAFSFAGFHAYVQDVAQADAGVIVGMTNSCSIVVGMAGTLATGWIVQATGSFQVIFGAMAVLYLSSFIAFCTLLRGRPLRLSALQQA